MTVMKIRLTTLWVGLLLVPGIAAPAERVSGIDTGGLSSAVRPQDSLAVVRFSDKSLFAHDLSKNRESTYQAIRDYQAAGGTALYDALKDSLVHLRSVEGRRVVVVVTDGRDENSTSTGSL